MPVCTIFVLAKPPIAVDLWHVSHAVVVGMCVVVLIFSGGFLTVLKLMPVLWQLAQVAPATTAWFIGAPANPPTAVFVAAWQPTQSAVVGMCPAPSGFGVIATANVLPVVAAMWQSVHLLVIPVWFITPDFGPTLPFAWHSEHAAVVGMWFVGMPPVTPVLNDTVDVWQLSHGAVVTGCPVPCGVGTTPSNFIPVAP